jgi:succinate dehydrogenase flavin-adding protein (antitoxin of CptAB toxin-antitoxin module)
MNKLKLFENTYGKLASDKSFMAYYLEQLIIRENKTKEDLITLLNCSAEDFYKLALCKAPEKNAANLKLRLIKIAEYTNTSALILSNILDPTLQTNNAAIKSATVIGKIIDDIKQLFPLPKWLLTARPFVYNAFATACTIILFVFIFNPTQQKTKNVQVFMGDYFTYTDSIKYIQQQDNTSVYKNKL